MKAVLEFNLPEEQEEFEKAQDAHRFMAALDTLRDELRAKHKYGEYGQHNEITRRVYAAVYDRFWQILNENAVGRYF